MPTATKNAEKNLRTGERRYLGGWTSRRKVTGISMVWYEGSRAPGETFTRSGRDDVFDMGRGEEVVVLTNALCGDLR
jgi:hypothetical protein